MAHPYPRGFLKGHAGTPTVVLGKVLSATAVTGLYLDGTSISQVPLPSVEPTIFGSYKHPNKGREFSNWLIENNTYLGAEVMSDVLRTGQIDLSEFGIKPSKYEWYVAPEPAMPSLSALFVEVGISDGSIATPYILGSGSPQKKDYPYSSSLQMWQIV
ncbi:hypothetical protein NC653_008144 [Populus alba x Populus x berolinensis]|uniref:Uncharacterized protein n=1 Tax=Populus alba x Populus x berolinensis TaxID=444605 RepID=A0AAD6R5R8_9ROSI|nr:hypothetical protein NC653_008144 [Populus alba x Populus x berolinensis]